MPAAAASASAACRQIHSYNQPDEASFINDLQYQPQLESSQLSAAGLTGADFGLYDPESVHADLNLSSFLDPSSWDTLPWTSAVSATPHISASPIENSIGQSFPYIDTTPPTLFDTFPDTLLPTQLDPLFASSDSSNNNSPNQLPLDMSVYTAAPGASSSHRASPTSEGAEHEAATPHADKILRRQRNTIAARKYRQKKVDRIADLEKLLEEMTRDRDDLRLRLARQEAETEALKSIMRKETKP